MTIKEIARIAGVSPSTVSRVLSGNPRISQATRERVLKVAEELGYHPNLQARSLVVKRAEAAAVILPRSRDGAFLNPFFPEVLRGIVAGLAGRKYAMLLVTGEDDAEKRDNVTRAVRGRQVDGVILLESRRDDPLIPRLVELRVPVVMIGRPPTREIAYVDNDNVAAAEAATAYLIARGHREIAFLGGSPEYTVTRDRLEGYRRALRRARIPEQAEIVGHADFTESEAYREVERILARERRPTAFVVADDLMALGVLAQARVRGLEVPRDVSLVSFNDTFLARLSTPPLHSVNIGIYELGFLAAQLLFELLDGGEPRGELVPTRLVERSSVACGPYAPKPVTGSSRDSAEKVASEDASEFERPQAP